MAGADEASRVEAAEVDLSPRGRLEAEEARDGGRVPETPGQVGTDAKTEVLVAGCVCVTQGEAEIEQIFS